MASTMATNPGVLSGLQLLARSLQTHSRSSFHFFNLSLAWANQLQEAWYRTSQQATAGVGWGEEGAWQGLVYTYQLQPTLPVCLYSASMR